MKKLSHYVFIILFWMATSSSNALASDFSVIDSDGDIYRVGEFMGFELNNQKYYVEYVNNSTSFVPTAEGFLYYDELYQSLKFIIFENDDMYGFTIDGHWHGNGSEVFYANGGGSTGPLGLYLGELLPRSRNIKTSVKQVLK